jgi:chemotaxis response regulator CheB
VIRVLVVDDSAVLRQGTRFILESDPELKVIGEAKNGEEAVALARRLRPDVITMDIRMPKMDGLEAIRHIMAENPVPIVIVSGIDLDRETDIASQATKLGAVSILRRPVSVSDPKYKAFVARLIEKVKLMSDVKVIHRTRTGEKAPPETRAPKPTAQPEIRPKQSDLVSGHRPSATALFESVAKAYGSAAMGVILTGMGSDGAMGMKALRDAGAITIAQDEESCVVFGMPKEAIALGAVQHIAPLDKMAQTMMALCVK